MGFRKNKMSYLKMFVEYVVPKEAERLVYVDSDTLVRGDLTPLMSIPMAERREHTSSETPNTTWDHFPSRVIALVLFKGRTQPEVQIIAVEEANVVLEI